MMERAEADMKATLASIERRRASEADLIAALRRSQEQWVAFRDAELEALFPEPDKQVAYGSMYGMCRSNQRRRLTEERTAQLRLWLNGDPEAQGCSGSR